MTRGFGSGRSPCWLRKSQRKLSRWRLWNHQPIKFQRWQVDSSARPAPVDLETVNENWATPVSEIVNETDSKGDAWIGSNNCPCWIRNSHWKLVCCRLKSHHLKTFQRWRVDSDMLAAPIDAEKVNENWGDGDWEIVKETSSKGDKCILQRAQPLLT